MARPKGFALSAERAGRGSGCPPDIHSLPLLQIPVIGIIKEDTPLGVSSFMARPKGFEPPTIRIGICYSIQLSYGRILRGFVSKASFLY